MIILIGKTSQINEFIGGKEIEGVKILENIQSLNEGLQTEAIIHLSYETSDLEILKKQNALVIVNCVEKTLNDIDPSFIRFNGWPGFLQKSIIEAAGAEALRAKSEKFFSVFDKTIQWVPDRKGLVTPRILAAIINEAELALEEGVSTQEEIDTAMKLGTNYPHGPFEWKELIGEDKIKALREIVSGE